MAQSMAASMCSCVITTVILLGKKTAENYVFQQVIKLRKSVHESSVYVERMCVCACVCLCVCVCVCVCA